MGTVTLFLSVLLIASFIPEGTMTSNVEEISQSINEFSIDLYEALRTTSQSENICVSPLSAEIVLALAKQGAKGPTACEMEKVLHLPADKGAELEGHRDLISELNDDPLLNIANKMFIEKNASLSSAFNEVATNNFLSAVEKEDFITKPEDSRQNINKWAEEKTNGKIKGLLPEGTIDSLTRLVLVNAIYFKGKWLKQFNEKLTRDENFYVTPEKTVSVKMMYLPKQTFRYMENQELDSKILEMPYEGGNISMVIICPNKLDGLAHVESKLKSFDVNKIMPQLYDTEVNVWLPRFKLEESMNLIIPLKKLGMNTCFSPEANFSGISPHMDLAISQVIQKTFIEVNEEGTEAAAATGLVTLDKTTILHFEPPPFIKCDRPFLFFIRHLSTDAVLFLSRIQTF